jgi:hypothetical protein
MSNETHGVTGDVLFITSILELKMNKNDILKNRQASVKNPPAKPVALEGLPAR